MRHLLWGLVGALSMATALMLGGCAVHAYSEPAAGGYYYYHEQPSAVYYDRYPHYYYHGYYNHPYVRRDWDDRREWHEHHDRDDHRWSNDR